MPHHLIISRDHSFPVGLPVMNDRVIQRWGALELLSLIVLAGDTCL
jgi:hypothetical protein